MQLRIGTRTVSWNVGSKGMSGLAQGGGKHLWPWASSMQLERHDRTRPDRANGLFSIVVSDAQIIAVIYYMIVRTTYLYNDGRKFTTLCFLGRNSLIFGFSPPGG